MAYDNPDNLSPWALRFGPLKLSWAIDANGVRHSGLGATHPDLDARYYHDVDGIDIPLKNPHVPRPSDTELDALFHRERSQQWILAGPKTRQLGALSAWTFLAESGHTLYHEDNLGGVPFNIDESTWFDFMQRNRWYKPEVEPTDTVPSPHLEPVSVENEIVWDHMRWSMQLVQRILWLMTEEQHYFLDAVLFGDVIVEETEATPYQLAHTRLLNPGESVPKRDDGKRSFVMHRPLDQRPTPVVFRKTIHDMCRNVIWSFTDENDDHNGSTSWASTCTLNGEMPPDEQGPILIYISAQFIRGLHEGTVTHAEKCSIYWAIALNVVHELMHAIWLQRWFCGEVGSEPFVGLDEMAELGCAAENAIFGGRLRPCSGPRFRKDGAYHGNFTNMSIDDWPNPWEVSIYTKSEFSQKRTLVDGMYPLTDGAKCFSWHVPAAWTSWLFTRDFWETAVPKYGSRALQVPKFMCGYTTLWRGFPRTTRLMALEPITEVKEIIPIMEKVRERFLQREQDYENIRPWQLVEYRRWEGSPWSWTAARDLINHYASHHARRELREAAGTAMVLYTISVNAVNEDRAASGGQLPLSPTYWIFNIIACLMYAALPEGSGPEKPDTMDYRFLLPTVYAMASHPVNSAEMLKSDPVLYCQKVVRFSSGTPAFKIDIPAQFQPINNLDEWMPKIDIAIDAWKNRQAPVHNDWLEATLNTLQEIRAYRTANHSPALWANWNFRIPDYVRSDSWVHWAVSLNTWVFYDANTSNFQEGFNPSPRGVNPAPTSAGPIPMPGPIPMVEDCKRSAFLKYKYFTIASVVDNGWIVDPNSDDSTVDVYDLKALIDGQDWDKLNFEESTFCGPNGRQLLDNRTELRKQLRDPRMRFHLGKLLPWYRPEEIVEFDGSDEMPSWTAFGGRVFDLTEYQCVDEAEREWLESSFGGPLKADTQQRQKHLDELLGNIQQFQIGFIMPLPTPKSIQEPNFLLTKSMLRRYDNPHDGLYTALDGYVYNIAAYVDFHPGGAQIFNTILGCDGTEAYLKHHPLSLLGSSDIILPRVGRLIEERQPGDIRKDEVVLHEFVLSLNEISQEDQTAQELLVSYHGADLTSKLAGSDEEDKDLSDLLTSMFLDYKRWVVARFPIEVALRDVTMDEVRQHRYPANTAWVVVDNDVFDITSILHYPQYYAENPGLKSENSGRVIGNSKIAAWLKKDHSHRIVARIMHSRSDSISVVDLSDGLSGLEDMPLSELEDVLDIDLSEPKSSRVTQDTNVSGDQQNNLKKRHADEAAVRSRKSKKVRIADQER